MPGVNRQGQAHIVSTALRLPSKLTASNFVMRVCFSIDPQPASISPTINISIVFICAFPVDCGRIICHPAIKNDSGVSEIRFDAAMIFAWADFVNVHYGEST
jgi:hypothetical protein